MAKHFSVGKAMVLVATLLGAADRATAQEQPDGAEEHYRRAGDSFQKGNYEETVRELNAAYSLTPLPRLLFNLAQAYRKWGHTQEALDQYELFLRTDPQLTPELRAEVEGYIKQLHAELRGPSQPDPSVLASTPAPTKPVLSARRTPHLPSEPEHPPTPLYKRAWFWGLVTGVVVTGAITAGVAAGTAGSPGQPLPPGTPVYSW